MNKDTLEYGLPLVATAWWPRFRRYEITDGRLHPAGHDYEIYDVWQGFVPGEKANGPQQALLDLAHAYETSSPPNFEAYLSDWASKHGLLGLGLARLVFTRYDLGGDRGWIAARSSGHVRVRQLLCGNEDPFATFAGGIPFPEVRFPEGYEPLTIVNPWLGRTWCESVSPHDYWRPYIPTFDEAVIRIGSPAFWRAYGEPVPEIVSAARLLASSVIATDASLPEMAADAALAIDESSQRVVWRSASLVGAFAAMALQERSGGFVYKVCDCSKTFAARLYENKPVKTYCSETCKARVKQRRRRARRQAE